MVERVAHEGARRRVMAACACVDVPYKLTTLGDGNAPLQFAGRGAPVQLAIDEGERFGHSGCAPSLGPIRGELPSIHVGEVLGPPVLRAGGWFRVHGLGLVHVVTLEQGEHKRLVRGVLIHGLRAH
jgi:hypothetical protein